MSTTAEIVNVLKSELKLAKLTYADSDFAVLRFPEELLAAKSHHDFVYLEHPGGGDIVKDLAKFLEYWDVLTAAALTRDKTVAFLDRRVEELRGDRDSGWPQ